MQVVQTAGEPPRTGRTIRAIIGWTENNKAAARKSASANSPVPARSRLCSSVGIGESSRVAGLAAMMPLGEQERALRRFGDLGRQRRVSRADEVVDQGRNHFRRGQQKTTRERQRQRTPK